MIPTGAGSPTIVKRLMRKERTMKMHPQAWIVRARPHHIDRSNEFTRGNLVALGWPNLGNLTGKQLQQIRLTLQKKYADYQPREMNTSANLLDAFVNRVRAGHFVLTPVPGGSTVFVGRFR